LEAETRNIPCFCDNLLYEGGISLVQRLAGKKVIGVKQTTKAIKNG